MVSKIFELFKTSELVATASATSTNDTGRCLAVPVELYKIPIFKCWRCTHMLCFTGSFSTTLPLKPTQIPGIPMVRYHTSVYDFIYLYFLCDNQNH